MSKYTEQFKLTAISAYLDGNNGFRKVAQLFGVDYSLLRRWVSSHQSKFSLSPRSNGQRYDDDFKRQVLSFMHEHRLSMRQTAAHFGLAQSSQIGNWQRQYYSGGLVAPVDRQKKPIKVPKKIKPAKPTDTDDSQKPRDQLLAELEYLRMENAVLKELGFAGGKGTNTRQKVLIASKLKPRFPLPDLLRLIGLARSTFYYQVQSQQKPDKHAELKEKIQQVYHKEKGRYGYRRVALVIRKGGVLVNKKVIEKLMVTLGLKSLVRPKKYKSYRGTVGKIATNLLERNFVAQRPNQKWVSDVTEFKVAQQKLYLSPVMDLYNGEIIAYETATRPQYSLVGNMLDKALKTLGEKPRLVLHTDQGWQYQQAQYRHTLRSRGVKQSMSRKGNCLDNAAMESFFGTLKSEFFYLKRFESIDELKAGLDEYIHYYNHDRIKLRLNGLSPVDYRTQAAA
ncbi:IS3 family transposase [Pseudomonas xanthosomatis]|uniref:IS3 family transposase n=1 Tax=Pseudomonas xanthosomatis TaxID=2842356 RepID=UPI001C3D21BE|nr:IS3 family transposase [Pseudomonas xanthosomatis]QXH45364.1 IS3 family transposase [Pseudomonas xanthosomatis]QXH46155.1 IS3 family transposase [Pseudomonas xanthosomatis]QXH48145.1 IS3 family transposase [Pseudomonas xanthosomatis]